MAINTLLIEVEKEQNDRIKALEKKIETLEKNKIYMHYI